MYISPPSILWTPTIGTKMLKDGLSLQWMCIGADWHAHLYCCKFAALAHVSSFRHNFKSLVWIFWRSHKSHHCCWWVVTMCRCKYYMNGHNPSQLIVYYNTFSRAKTMWTTHVWVHNINNHLPSIHACKGDKDILRPKSITTCTHMVPIAYQCVGWLVGISYAIYLEVAHGITQCKTTRETTKAI